MWIYLLLAFVFHADYSTTYSPAAHEQNQQTGMGKWQKLLHWHHWDFCHWFQQNHDFMQDSAAIGLQV